MQQVRAKKSLGQHFLIDLNIAKRIADSLTAFARPTTLEIGPGMGVLTQYLIERKELDFYACELDRESIAFLNEKYPVFSKKLIEGDFLKLNLPEMFPNGVNIVGNFPYNISSQIFFKVLDNRELVSECVGMIQKEVAVRMAEKPGTREYGILSVLMQAFYDIEYLFTVNESVFNPPPKVKSAVIRLTRNSRAALDCDERLFFRVVKGAFNQRRKTLRNALRAAFPQIGDKIHEFFPLRAERLSVDDFVVLTNFVAEAIDYKNEATV